MAAKNGHFQIRNVTMEGICLRFPHLIEQINEELDNKTLVKFKDASRLVFKITTKQKGGKFFCGPPF